MYLWIFVCGILFAFYNAWGGGANDCANSFATAVGSKTLTLKQAVLVASVFEFCGAVFMGSHVTDAVRKNIVSEDLFSDNPGALMFGMLCADLASALWLTFATYVKWPVSTTHSIIGAIIGFSLAYGGAEGINWNKVGLIVVSWFASPLIAGVFSLTIFTFVKKYVFDTVNPYERTARLFPVLTFITFFINTLFIIYKGSPQLDLDEMPIGDSIGISFGIAFGTGLIAWFIYVPYAKRQVERGFISEIQLEKIGNTEGDSRTNSYTTAMAIENSITETSSDLIEDTLEKANNEDDDDLDTIEYHSKRIKELENESNNSLIEKLHENAYQIDEKSDKLCSWLQIFTSCFSSFAHGSNDVANAVAPLATIFSIYQNNEVLEETEVPIWILVLGGTGIVLGLATWGYKIIDRIGRELTKVSPSRGFIIELSAAITVIIASRTELPVSTTHCQVGSVVGCGLSGGRKNVQWKLLKGILWSWFITVPLTGLLSASLFSYGYFAPSSFSSNVTFLE
jgi:solute carrier family 20 (sodium-dependent phosphate transporter)